MRIARVIGKVTLNRRLPDVEIGPLLIVQPANRGTLAGANDGSDESVVMFDPLGAREGMHVGLVEGREAAMPFWPRKVPFDAYCGCILDTVNFQPVLPVTEVE
ncbi:MAG: hypothetical protein BIFFINMI_02296 [Phycisphaerae bacterium]|nr:hypothetical protein [Phycisphaerae bacterium]